MLIMLVVGTGAVVVGEVVGAGGGVTGVRDSVVTGTYLGSRTKISPGSFVVQPRSGFSTLPLDAMSCHANVQISSSPRLVVCSSPAYSWSRSWANGTRKPGGPSSACRTRGNTRAGRRAPVVTAGDFCKIFFIH